MPRSALLKVAPCSRIFHDEHATEVKQLEYFNKWDNEMLSMNAWVDILWLSLAAKMLNINLRIYSPR